MTSATTGPFLGWGWMSNPGEPDVVTSPRFPAHLSAIPAPREQRQDRDLCLRIDDPGVMTLPLASPDETAGGYRHEALLYSGMAEFLTAATSFIRQAVQAGDPVLVVVTGSKADALRRELGAETQGVRFADMAKVGGNPGRIIAALLDFANAHAGGPQLAGERLHQLLVDKGVGLDPGLGEPRARHDLVDLTVNESGDPTGDRRAHRLEQRPGFGQPAAGESGRGLIGATGHVEPGGDLGRDLVGQGILDGGRIGRAGRQRPGKRVGQVDRPEDAGCRAAARSA